MSAELIGKPGPKDKPPEGSRRREFDKKKDAADSVKPAEEKTESMEKRISELEKEVCGCIEENQEMRQILEHLVERMGVLETENEFLKETLSNLMGDESNNKIGTNKTTD